MKTVKAIWTGDNLKILRRLKSGLVDLIYLDPPFNSNKFYQAPIGSPAEGAGFKDIWTWQDADKKRLGEIKRENEKEWLLIQNARLNHSASMAAYLLMLLPRVKEMARVLKTTGSIYLHCDSSASHYLKGLMDLAFGAKNFRSEIVWKMPRPSGFKTQAKNWIRGHDIILYYVCSNDFTFNKIYEPYEASYLKHFKHEDAKGKYWLRSGVRRYLGKGYNLSSNWIDIHSMQTQAVSKKECTGYPTQKPLALLRRIIEASSNEDDLVLDPFCGSATTCVAAEELGRQWIGIDISEQAIVAAKRRIRPFTGLWRRND